MSYAAPNAPHSGVVAVPRRAYITTSAFNTDLFTYTVNTNPTTFVRTGTLAANVTGATASSCPANRILRENGKRLYPDANPQVSTLMVGVYDAVSGLSGYIDPNAPKFAVYNSDKAYYMPNGIDPATSLTDQGNPVYTRGSVTAGTTITATQSVTAGTGVVATTGTIRAATVTALTGITLSTGSANVATNIDPTLGQVFTLAVTVTGGTNTGTLTCSPAAAAGSVVYVIVNTGGSHTTAFNITAGSGVKMAQITCGTVASKTFGITLVSDGTNLVQVGGDVAPTAL